MNGYTKQHPSAGSRPGYYCGIDLHTRSMYICILDDTGQVVYHKNRRCTPEALLEAIGPYREGIIIGVECMFCWQGIAELCRSEGIDFILGHALYMRAIYGVKTKNDRIDSLKIARRIHFVRKRTELIGPIRNTAAQYNLAPLGALSRAHPADLAREIGGGCCPCSEVTPNWTGEVDRLA